MQLHLPVDLPHRQGPAWTWCGQLHRPILPSGDAVIGKGTAGTVRPGACAQNGPQIHLCLRIVRHDARILRQQPLSQRPQLLRYPSLARPPLNTEQAAQHPFYIAVQNGFPLAVRLRHDGRRGGTANTRQGFPVCPILRKSTPGHNLPCGPVQVARPRIVAQPLPLRQHLIQRRFSQHPHIRKHVHETLKIGDDGLHLRLLQHDLRHPDSIGRARMLPRQVMTAMFSMPGQQTDGKMPDQPLSFFRFIH